MQTLCGKHVCGTNILSEVSFCSFNCSILFSDFEDGGLWSSIWSGKHSRTLWTKQWEVYVQGQMAGIQQLQRMLLSFHQILWAPSGHWRALEFSFSEYVGRSLLFESPGCVGAVHPESPISGPTAYVSCIHIFIIPHHLIYGLGPIVELQWTYICIAHLVNSWTERMIRAEFGNRNIINHDQWWRVCSEPSEGKQVIAEILSDGMSTDVSPLNQLGRAGSI